MGGRRGEKTERNPSGEVLILVLVEDVGGPERAMPGPHS